MQELKSPELTNVRNSVVFIFDDAQNPCTNTKAMPMGTGFIVGFRLKEDPARFFKFVVTNAHVLDGRKAIYVRLNNVSETGSVCERIDLTTSSFLPTDKSFDLAAFSLPDSPDTSPAVIDYSFMLGVQQLKKGEIDEGTEVVGMGFLNPYAGMSRNFPVMRFGKIALFTDEKWVDDGKRPVGQGYLVEIYNVGGSSGSPVVLQPSQVRINKDNVFQQRRISPYVIGVIKGHPNTLVEAFEVQGNQLVKSPGKYVAVSSGVAIVEPGENLKVFMREIAALLESRGHHVIMNEAF